MDRIDMPDLPEEEAELVAVFVEFLRRRTQEQTVREAEAEERDWAYAAARSCARDWDNTADAMYDTWREHSHVPEGGRGSPAF
jgi:hypothetical protein